MGGIIVDVMSCRNADSRTVYPSGLTLVRSTECEVRGPFDPTPERPAVMIVRKRFSFGEGLQAVLVEPVETGGWRMVRGEGAGPMFNGRFIWTGDSRFGDATGQGAFATPVKLMDRWESAELAASMD